MAEKKAIISVTIDGVTFEEGSIVSLNTRHVLFTKDKLVGNCNSAEIELTIRGDVSFARKAAKVIPRAVFENGHVVQGGVFYINEREISKESGISKIHGYDALFKANAKYRCTVGNDGTAYPRYLLNEICKNLGIVQWNSRWVYDFPIKVKYPWTYSDALSEIASFSFGNFKMDQEVLTLVPFTLKDDSNLLINEQGSYITIGGNRILIR